MISGESIQMWSGDMIIIEHYAQVILCGRYVNIHDVIHRKYQICGKQLTIQP